MPSTVIRWFQYDPEKKRLEVGFQTGAVYAYLDLPPDVFEKMKSARSRGKFLNEEIKGKYPFEKTKDPSQT
jgi:hypothetical protein